MALLTLALLTLGGVSMQAATETYDFVKVESGSTALPSWGSEVNSGGVALNMLAYGEDDFNNRFAVGPTSRNNDSGNCFKFRTNGDYKGLWSQYGDRNFTILNLVKGNRVTMTISKGDETLKFVGGDVVVSGKTYTVATAGNLDFVTTGGVYIEKVVIEDPVASEVVTVGTPAVDITYDFTQIVPNASDKVVPINQDIDHQVTTSSTNKVYKLAIAGNDFDNRFGVGGYTADRTGDGGFHFFRHGTNGSTYKGLFNGYSGRTFSILNLKKDDKVTITISNNGSTLAFFDKDATEYAGSAVVSGDVYTVDADGSLDFISTGSVYIEKVRIQHDAINIGGATLVSANALDFTDVDAIKAYVATEASKGIITFKQVKKVPADTPLYLTADVAVSFDVPILEGDPETIETNLLKGSASTTKSLTSTEDTKYYAFGVQDGEAGFYLVPSSGSFISAAGKAYLELTAEQASAESRLAFNFVDGETTGISESVSKAATDGRYYDLQGRRVALPTKGLYIVNGKKVIVK